MNIINKSSLNDKTFWLRFTVLCVVTIGMISCFGTGVSHNLKKTKVSRDSHVHIMSPELIATFKELGIPFSKSESYYSNIDSIVQNNKADFIDLIGMGYVYGNSEFYGGTDTEQKLQNENDYLFEVANKYKKKIRPFFTIDPLMESAIPEIKRCVRAYPDSGLKLHFSSSQVYLTEMEHLNKVKLIFELAAKQELPILLHFDNWHPKFGAPDITLLVDSILNNMPPLELRVAHFGTSGGFNQKTKIILNTFIKLFDDSRIPERHTILFDISAVALNKNSEGVEKLTDSEFKELKGWIDRLGLDNVIFGSDYPLYTSDEYIHVLSEKLGFTDIEINSLMK